MLKNSISMVRKYNKEIKIKVISVGSSVEINDDNLEVIVKPDNNVYPFPLNKIHLREIQDESVLFLDCDTFIFDNVEEIYQEYQEYDFVACEDDWAYHKGYKLEFLTNKTKPFNSGVMFFNNYSHQKIYENLDKITNSLKITNPEFWNWLTKFQWTMDEFVLTKIIDDLQLKHVYFQRKFAYNIKWKEDFDKMSESIIFHSYTNQWEKARERTNNETLY